MGHLRRIAVSAILFTAVFTLGIIIDGVATPLIDLNYEHGVDGGPFAPVLAAADGVTGLLIPAMLLGIALWLLYGTVKEERREEVRRRVGP